MANPFAKRFSAACSVGNILEADNILAQWEKSNSNGLNHGATLLSDHPLQAGLIAAAEHGQGGIIEHLLSNGFRVSPNVILAASKSQSTAVFQAMIGSGWDINHSAGLTGDALSHAAAADRYTMTKWLLEHGADPNCNQRAEMWTTLDLAVMHASPATVNLLIDYGAQVRNTNALLVAAHYGRIDMLQILLDNGADTHEIAENNLISDYDGLSALDIAKREDQQEAINYLEERDIIV